jgi:hypothetical protein
VLLSRPTKYYKRKSRFPLFAICYAAPTVFGYRVRACQLIAAGIGQMMFLRMTVSSLSVDMASIIHRNEQSSPRSGHTISMEVYPSDRDYIELKTGEVFCDPRYLKFRGKDRESISATLSILPASSDEDHAYSRMIYHKAVGNDLEYHPSSIHFSCFLSPGDFADILSDIRNGIAPSSVTVEVDEKVADAASALTFGWEPDGSGMKWNNDKAASGKLAIKIDRISLTSPKLASNVEVLKQTKELKSALGLIRDDVRYYGQVVSIAVIAIAVMILYWLLHMR